MKRLTFLRGIILTGIALALLFPLIGLTQDTTAVTAEAYIEANLRATTDVNAELVGQIQSGTVYPVIGRSEFYPWVLIGDPTTQTPIGWVFQDLVMIQGNVFAVPISNIIINQQPTPLPPTATLNPAIAITPTPPAQPDLVGVAMGALATPTASATPQPMGIMGELSGEVNIRFGPGVEYPRIGVGRQGDMFEVTAYHTQFPWVQIRYAEVTGGYGWIARDLIEIDGNIFSLPAVNRTAFDLPTLTPTPNAVTVANTIPDFIPPALSPEFAALGEQLWDKVLSAGFEPETSRIGSLFLMDLQTGETLTFGDDVAYSGMSLSKINILTAMYRQMEGLPNGEEARHLASMMICSENTSSNQILSYIGGDPYSGASYVTDMLRTYGLQDTFMVAPFLIDPRITPQPVAAPQSPANQEKANPDPFNQMTVSETGGLLYGIYQCATDYSGPLVSRFGDAFSQRECQQMLYLMSGNRIGALLEVGVPEGIQVAHKHGWINDTHGDAGIVFTPGGNYVLVVVLHNPTWLNFEESFPLIEDISLTVYNYYNPDAPLTQTRQSNVPEVCDLSNTEGLTIIDNLTRGRTN